MSAGQGRRRRGRGRSRRGLFHALRADDALFSTWKADSEVSRIRRGELLLADADPRVRHVAALCGRQPGRTSGSFDAWLPGADGVRVFDPTGLVKGWAVEEATRGSSRGCRARRPRRAGVRRRRRPGALRAHRHPRLAGGDRGSARPQQDACRPFRCAVAPLRRPEPQPGANTSLTRDWLPADGPALRDGHRPGAHLGRRLRNGGLRARPRYGSMARVAHRPRIPRRRRRRHGAHDHGR